MPRAKKKTAKNGEVISLPGTAQVLPGPKVEEPQTEKVVDAELVQDLVDLLDRFLVYREGYSLVVALWALHTHALECFSHSPRLHFISPEPGWGKTTSLQILEAIAFNAELVIEPTKAGMKREADSERIPTFLLDETDEFEGIKGFTALFNSGFTRDGGRVLQCNTEDYETIERFSLFCPVAFAGLRPLPQRALRSRIIKVMMLPARASDGITKWIPKEHKEPIREKFLNRMTAWGLRNKGLVQACDPEMPKELSDRQQDKWKPLLALAELTGHEEPLRKVITQAIRSEDPNGTAQILSKIRKLFDASEEGTISSSDLAKSWPKKGNQPVSQRGLAQDDLLDGYDIKPQRLYFGKRRLRGYKREQFEELFDRVLEGWVDEPEDDEDEDQEEDGEEEEEAL